MPQEFKTLKEAREAAIKLTNVNRVGWSIYNSQTYELVG